LGFLAFGRLGERVDYEVIREGTMTKLALTLFTWLTLVGAADVAGTWDVETEFDDARLSGGGFDCTFTQDREHFTGTCSGAPVTGDVKDQTISLGDEGRWRPSRHYAVQGHRESVRNRNDWDVLRGWQDRHDRALHWLQEVGHHLLRQLQTERHEFNASGV
jgi:hypothetical protein